MFEEPALVWAVAVGAGGALGRGRQLGNAVGVPNPGGDLVRPGRHFRRQVVLAQQAAVVATAGVNESACRCGPPAPRRVLDAAPRAIQA